MSETELKFTLDDHTTADLRARLCASEPVQRHLRSVYFDTKKHHLRQAGVALRLRQDGEDWIQTVKAKARNRHGLQISQEAECALTSPELRLKSIPDKALRKSVKALAKGRRLHPVCETDIDRSLLVLHNRTAAVEIALDQGQIIAGDRAEPFQELELELKSGDIDSLYDLARILLPNGGLDPSAISKAERGYLLAATGEISPTLAPRNARAIALHPDMPASEALAAVVEECADQILTNLTVVRHLDDDEGPHQLRIGLRRLRSAFVMFRKHLAGPEAQHLRREAKWLGQMVGIQRDLDVALVDLLGPALKADPASTGLRQLYNNVEARGARNRTILRDILEITRTQSFALALARFLQSRAWCAETADKHLVRPISQVSATALNRAWSKTQTRAGNIKTLDHAARHELRKSLKELRYQIEFAAPLHKPKKVQATLKRVKALQQVFGELNDLAMLVSLFDPARGHLPEDAETQAALRHLLSQLHTAADTTWKDARKLWRRLESQPVFWQ